LCRGGVGAAKISERPGTGLPEPCLSSSDAEYLHQTTAHLDPERTVSEASRVLDRLFDGVRPLRLEEAVFDSVLRGWHNQQKARGLENRTVRALPTQGPGEQGNLFEMPPAPTPHTPGRPGWPV
jgi:hypothetical protein